MTSSLTNSQVLDDVKSHKLTLIKAVNMALEAAGYTYCES